MNARREVARRMSEAAAALLDSLDAEQRALAGWPFPADDERLLWFYTPTDHGGLPLSAMRPAQQRHAMQLVAHRPVTRRVRDGVDDHRSGERARRARRLGRPSSSASGAATRGSTTCACSAFPTRTARGHGGSVGTTSRSTTPSSTARSSDRHPCFLGADPASSPLLGPHLLRPLAGAEDLGRELVRSLDDAQRRRHDPVSGRTVRPRDRESGPPCPRVTSRCRSPTSGDDASTVTSARRWRRSSGRPSRHAGRHGPSTSPRSASPSAPKGIPAADLGPDQRQLLRALLDVYVHRIPDELADAEIGEVPGRRRPRRSCRSPGQVASSPASPTTTGSRAGACWPSTTTPSAASTTSTRCGATSNRTSVAMPSPSTTPDTTTTTTLVTAAEARHQT